MCTWSSGTRPILNTRISNMEGSKGLYICLLVGTLFFSKGIAMGYNGQSTNNWDVQFHQFPTENIGFDECKTKCDNRLECVGFLYFEDGTCINTASMHFDYENLWRVYYQKGVTSDPVVIPPCDHPGSIANGDVSAANPVPQGATAEYSCHEGYTMLGPYRRTCQGNYRWDLTFPPTCNAECYEVTDQLICAHQVDQAICEALGCCFLPAFNSCRRKAGRVYILYGGKKPADRPAFDVLRIRTPESCQRECDIRSNCKSFLTQGAGTANVHCHLLDFTYTEVAITDDAIFNFHSSS
jgi:hypothetical protein